MGLWPGHPGECHPSDLWSGSHSHNLQGAVMAEEEAKQKEALNNTLKEYIAEWRKTREKEEEELKKLKEKQAKRKEIRAEQEKKINQQKKEEEEKAKYPPMIRMYSKYERRTDTRTYDDRKKLYEGGWEVIRAETLDAVWKETTRSGPRGQARSFQSGSERGLARRLEMLPHLRERRRVVRKQLPRRKKRKRKRRRRRKRRRSKSNPHQSLICVTFLTALATWSPFRILLSLVPDGSVCAFPNILEDSRGFLCCNKFDFYFWQESKEAMTLTWKLTRSYPNNN